MAKKAVSVVTKETSSPESHKEDVHIWRERELSEEELFQGTDEAGRTGWFIRLTMPGMFPRRIGPYDTKEEALGLDQDVIGEVVMDTLVGIQNGLDGRQACIVEGVPRLIASA